MTAAVVADMAVHGPDRVAALAVTHADCEALADRIRAELTEQGIIAGPHLEGPGWTTARRYQTGDRILLHAHSNPYLADGTRLTNGTVATILHVTTGGLIVRPDGQDQHAWLSQNFITAKGPDGRPKISHAWARTIDGVQGGTWDQVHLLATPALDGYRGYVGQSRSIQPTHTWNTIPPTSDDDDHGGRLVRPHSTPADQIAAALARTQPQDLRRHRRPLPRRRSHPSRTRPPPRPPRQATPRRHQPPRRRPSHHRRPPTTTEKDQRTAGLLAIPPRHHRRSPPLQPLRPQRPRRSRLLHRHRLSRRSPIRRSACRSHSQPRPAPTTAGRRRQLRPIQPMAGAADRPTPTTTRRPLDRGDHQRSPRRPPLRLRTQTPPDSPTKPKRADR